MSFLQISAGFEGNEGRTGDDTRPSSASDMSIGKGPCSSQSSTPEKHRFGKSTFRVTCQSPSLLPVALRLMVHTHPEALLTADLLSHPQKD